MKTLKYTVPTISGSYKTHDAVFAAITKKASSIEITDERISEFSEDSFITYANNPEFVQDFENDIEKYVRLKKSGNSLYKMQESKIKNDLIFSNLYLAFLKADKIKAFNLSLPEFKKLYNERLILLEIMDAIHPYMLTKKSELMEVEFTNNPIFAKLNQKIDSLYNGIHSGDTFRKKYNTKQEIEEAERKLKFEREFQVRSVEQYAKMYVERGGVYSITGMKNVIKYYLNCTAIETKKIQATNKLKMKNDYRVAEYRNLNPSNTQVQCAQDLNLGIATVKRLWHQGIKNHVFSA